MRILVWNSGRRQKRLQKNSTAIFWARVGPSGGYDAWFQYCAVGWRWACVVIGGHCYWVMTRLRIEWLRELKRRFLYFEHWGSGNRTRSWVEVIKRAGSQFLFNAMKKAATAFCKFRMVDTDCDTSVTSSRPVCQICPAQWLSNSVVFQCEKARCLKSEAD